MQIFFLILSLIFLVIALLWILVPAFYGLPPISTKPERIRKALKMANLQPGETLYDLGCGHGQVLIIAAKEFGANAVGIEAGPVQCIVARINAIRNGVNSKVRIEAGDFFKSDLKKADVVYAYLTSNFAGRLQEKFKKELRNEARVVTVAFNLPREPLEMDRENLIYRY